MTVQFIIHPWGFECRFCRTCLDMGRTPTFEEMKTARHPCQELPRATATE